ncbi:hypothetical protein EDC01DRAFT_636918 [Geopyxis carbonaria]|nr:hypothetical protein EDC01DRAFT_636918 [Geopyxis carbonaria]
MVKLHCFVCWRRPVGLRARWRCYSQSARYSQRLTLRPEPVAIPPIVPPGDMPTTTLIPTPNKTCSDKDRAHYHMHRTSINPYPFFSGWAGMKPKEAVHLVPHSSFLRVISRSFALSLFRSFALSLFLHRLTFIALKHPFPSESFLPHHHNTPTPRKAYAIPTPTLFAAQLTSRQKMAPKTPKTLGRSITPDNTENILAGITRNHSEGLPLFSPGSDQALRALRKPIQPSNLPPVPSVRAVEKAEALQNKKSAKDAVDQAIKETVQMLYEATIKDCAKEAGETELAESKKAKEDKAGTEIPKETKVEEKADDKLPEESKVASELPKDTADKLVTDKAVLPVPEASPVKPEAQPQKMEADKETDIASPKKVQKTDG